MSKAGEGIRMVDEGSVRYRYVVRHPSRVSVHIC